MRRTVDGPADADDAGLANDEIVRAMRDSITRFKKRAGRYPSPSQLKSSMKRWPPEGVEAALSQLLRDGEVSIHEYKRKMKQGGRMRCVTPTWRFGKPWE